jgi:hypothetical protein
MCRSDWIRSGQSATGAIGTALAGEVTNARLPVPRAPTGSRGVRGVLVARHKERLLERYRRMQTWQW